MQVTLKSYCPNKGKYVQNVKATNKMKKLLINFAKLASYTRKQANSVCKFAIEGLPTLGDTRPAKLLEDKNGNITYFE